jgi:adenosylcobinamide-GDP ribazoletransferase
MHSFRSACVYQWQLFCLAIMFFTRLPVSKNLPYSSERMNRASRYYSLVGIVLALILALAFYWLQSTFSLAVSIVLMMVFSVLLTGAFHEDGLADMADGIGGGYTIERRLTIMKDSRIGTYGAVSLVLVLLLKFTLLVDLAQAQLLIPSLFLAYALSRAVSASLILNTPYVADIDSSKSKPLADQQSLSDLIILLVIGCLPFLFFNQSISVFSLMFDCCLVLIVFRWGFRKWLLSRIGGFTGDCLGAAQQVSELLIYLVILAQLSDPMVSISTKTGVIS